MQYKLGGCTDLEEYSVVLLKVGSKGMALLRGPELAALETGTTGREVLVGVEVREILPSASRSVCALRCM